MHELVEVKGRVFNVAPQEIDIVEGDAAPGNLTKRLEFPKPKLIERRVANRIGNHDSRGFEEFLRITLGKARNGQTSYRTCMTGVGLRCIPLSIPVFSVTRRVSDRLVSR